MWVMVEPEEPRLRELLDHWQSMRGGRAAPARADFDPIEIPNLLRHLVLVDTAKSLGEFRYRLFGTEVCRGFGYDRTGKRFSDLPRIEKFNTVYQGYWLTFIEKVLQYFHGRIGSAEENYIGYSRLTLPLSSDGDYVDMILGGVVFLLGDETSAR